MKLSSDHVCYRSKQGYNQLRVWPGVVMKLLRASAVIFLLALCAPSLGASDQKPAANSGKLPPMTKETRLDLVRAFEAELVYIRTPFPMGKKGLEVKNGQVSPSGAELQQLMAMWGPSVKPGDAAKITNIIIKDNRIRFEINGGPVKKQKWYQRISVGGAGGEVPVAPSDADANPRGSYADLVFDHYVPELNPDQLKQLLRPVFDFDAKSALESYLDTLSPKLRDAIKAHQVLVGMDRDMVVYAKGKPPRKIREKDGETEYEDWVYGEPPQDVDFVRLVNNEVVRVETMKVSGEKIVRTEKEIDLPNQPAVAKKDEPRPPNAPTLRRPGEDQSGNQPDTVKQPIDHPTVGAPPNILSGATHEDLHNPWLG